MFSKPSKSMNEKTSKKLLDRGKYIPLLLYTSIPSNCTAGFLLHLQCYQRWEPTIFKMWVKSKFVLWQQQCYNYLLSEEKGKKIYIFLSTHFFWKHFVTVNLKRFFLSSDYILGVNFTWSNSITLVEELIRWRRDFEIFLIDHYTGDTGNKNLLLHNK